MLDSLKLITDKLFEIFTALFNFMLSDIFCSIVLVVSVFGLIVGLFRLIRGKTDA